jgi:CRISPR-associated endonuclease/helicase Cas3
MEQMTQIQFISHPSEIIDGREYGEKLLQEHLNGVAQNAYTYIRGLCLFPNDKISKCAFIAGSSHDFGKYTTYFQQYIKNRELSKSKLSSHALLSSVFGGYSVLELLGDAETEMAFLTFMAISHHHRNLTSPQYFFGKHEITLDKEIVWDNNIRDRIIYLRKQIDDLKKNSDQIEQEIRSVYAESGIKWNKDYPSVKYFLEDGWINTINKVIKASKTLISQGTVIGNELSKYFDLLMIYSALLDGDKRDAGRIPEDLVRPQIPANIVTTKINELSASSSVNFLQKLRGDLFKKVKTSINEIELKQHHILSLTAPTGSGKTLSALYAGLRLRERLAESSKSPFRLIYCLPYTSIIDQNYRVMESMLETVGDFQQMPSRYLLKHHHLSDLDLKSADDENEKIPIEMALSLTESWDSEIIVTTFVQLFQSLIGNKNKFLRKVHRISNSIIILDEIQSINVKHWTVIGETLKQAASFMNCYFVFLTATQPLILPEKEKVEIGFGEFNTGLNRTRLSFLKDKRTEEEIDNEILISVERTISVLVIRNTIRLSVAMFNRLKEKLNGGRKGIKLLYLSANIIPKDRGIRIKEIATSIENKEKIIVVSTQVVEAGLDLDFGEVFRDLGPIDSIIQAAGRCNRNNRMGYAADVKIINLLEEQDQGYKYPRSSAAVYGSIHMDIAYEILKNIEKVAENEYSLVLKDYHDKIKERKYLDNPASSHKLFQNMTKLNFDIDDEKDVKSFSVIEKTRPMVSLFVAKDEECSKLLEWYRDKILCNKDPKERKKEFLLKRSEFNSCMISIDKKRARECAATPLSQKEELYVLESALCKVAYDNEIGLKRIDDALLAL